METNDIINNNKLIAEFMNIDADVSDYLEYISSKCEIKKRIGVDIVKEHLDIVDFKFHSSWDWLMPVVQRIMELYYDESEAPGYFTKEKSIEYQLGFYGKFRPITRAETYTHGNINILHKTVAEFIKWYNKNYDTKTKSVLSDKDIKK